MGDIDFIANNIDQKRYETDKTYRDKIDNKLRWYTVYDNEHLFDINKMRIEIDELQQTSPMTPEVMGEISWKWKLIHDKLVEYEKIREEEYEKSH